MTAPVMGWWFGRADLKLPNGDGRIVKVGEMHEFSGNLELCRAGLHASERIIDALHYAPGPMLYRVRCSGEIVRGDDKLVCSRREYIAGANAGDVVDEFARWCALEVSHLWEAPDVVIYYLLSGDLAARAAAWAAAWDAARAAAREAARAAAREAAREAARDAAWAAAGDAAWAAAGEAARDAKNIVLTQMAEELLGLEPSA